MNIIFSILLISAVILAIFFFLGSGKLGKGIKRGGIIITILAIIAVIAAAAILGSSALNKGIKNGVEIFGPKITQTPVTLDDVSLSILSGRGSLKGLNIGNPEGFKSGNIFAIGQIDIHVDTSSVFSDKIIINKIHIRKPEISYEKSLTNSNVNQLMKNIEAFTGPSKDKPKVDEPERDSGSQKQVVIKQLIIEDGTIFIGLMGLGSTVPLPRIEMNDIGEDGNKKSMADVLDLVLSELLNSIRPAIANSGQILQDSGKAALDAAQKVGLDAVDSAAKDTLNKASESIKGLFGK
jgi:hypothetical protein